VTGKLQRTWLPVIALISFQIATFAAEREVMPTFAKEGSAHVSRGGEVQIVLEAIPDYGNPITFEIQSKPTHGRLSELSESSDHTAVVIYQHDGSKGVLYDEFQFRAQSPGRAKSPATRVSITVIPPPARLEIEPGEINFGTLFLGEKSRTNITIHNVGGMLATGRIVFPVGYSAPEGNEFSVNEGERKSMTVEFSSQEVKSYVAQAASLPAYAGASLQLRGEGKARFGVTQTDPLTCLLTNNSDQVITLSFTGDSAWVMPPRTELPPHNGKEVFFQQAEHDDETPAASFFSQIHISDGISTEDIELPPVQGFIPLSVTATQPTNFGIIPLGDSLPINFSIQNRSEMTKSIRWTAISSSGGGMLFETPLLVKGGEIKNMHYDWKPALPGEATLKISVKEGTKTTHDLLWQASVKAIRSESDPNSSPPPDATETEDTGDQSVPAVSFRTPPVSPIDDLSWNEKTYWNGKNGLEIHWQENGGTVSRMKIEKSVMHPKGRTSNEAGLSEESPFVVESIPLEFSSIRERGSEKIGEIENIVPGFHLLRLSRISKEGVLVAQSQIQVLIHPQKTWWSRLKTPTTLLVLVLLGAFLWKQRS
jgi:hypothetical protein